MEEIEGVKDNTSAFMHLNIKINKSINNGKKLLFKPSQVIYIRQKAKFLNFMVMQVRKPENEGTFLGSNEKKIQEKNKDKTEAKFAKSFE